MALDNQAILKIPPISAVRLRTHFFNPLTLSLPLLSPDSYLTVTKFIIFPFHMHFTRSLLFSYFLLVPFSQLDYHTLKN